MIELRGDFWGMADNYTRLVVTTNNCIRGDGRLVMGAGIARQFRDRYPGLDTSLARAIKKQDGPYYMVLSPEFPSIIALQTKENWKDSSPLWLVEASCQRLGDFATAHPEERILMTRPGCGNGGLSWDQVKLRLSLPDNVHVITNQWNITRG